MTQPKKNPNLNETVQKARQEAQKQTEPPHVRYRRATIVQVYVAVATIGFLILAIFALTSKYFFFDVSFTREFQEFAPPWFESLMIAVSWLGFAPQVLIVIALMVALLYIFGYKWEAAALFIAAVLSLSVNLLVKTLVARPRPAANLINVFGHLLTSYSFPSGHVMFYVSFYGFLWFLTYTLLRHGPLRVALLVVFGLLVLLVGPSRVYLGQHWSSDVLGGYLLGSVVLIATISIYRWGKPQFFKDQEAATPDAKA